MPEKDNTGFARLTYGDKKSIVQSKNDINSGETSSVNEVLASGKDPFHGLSEPFAKRIQAFNDRIDMRRNFRAKKLDRPGSDRITSQYVSRTEQGEIDTPKFGKLDEKNLKLENKLNEKLGLDRISPPKLDKKNLQAVSTGGSTVTNSNINNVPTPVISNISGAASIKPQASISKPAAKAIVIDANDYADPSAKNKWGKVGLSNMVKKRESLNPSDPDYQVNLDNINKLITDTRIKHKLTAEDLAKK